MHPLWCFSFLILVYSISFCPYTSLTLFLNFFFEFLILSSALQLEFPKARSGVPTLSHSTHSFSAILSLPINPRNGCKWQHPNLYLHSRLFYVQTYTYYGLCEISNWISYSIANLTTLTLDISFRIYCYSSDHTSANDTPFIQFLMTKTCESSILNKVAWCPTEPIS